MCIFPTALNDGVSKVVSSAWVLGSAFLRALHLFFFYLDMSNLTFNTDYLYNLPAAAVHEFTRVMDSLPDFDWQRFGKISFSYYYYHYLGLFRMVCDTKRRIFL